MIQSLLRVNYSHQRAGKCSGRKYFTTAVDFSPETVSDKRHGPGLKNTALKDEKILQVSKEL